MAVGVGDTRPSSFGVTLGPCHVVLLCAHLRACVWPGPALPEGWTPSLRVAQTSPLPSLMVQAQQPGPGGGPPQACCPGSQILRCPPCARKVLFLLWPWLSAPPTLPSTQMSQASPWSHVLRALHGVGRAEGQRRTPAMNWGPTPPTSSFLRLPCPGPSMSRAHGPLAVWPAQGVHMFCTSARVCT